MYCMYMQHIYVVCGNKTLTYPFPKLLPPPPSNQPTYASPLSYPSKLRPMSENKTKFDTPLQVTVTYFSVRTAGLPLSVGSLLLNRKHFKYLQFIKYFMATLSSFNHKNYHLVIESKACGHRIRDVAAPLAR